MSPTVTPNAGRITTSSGPSVFALFAGIAERNRMPCARKPVVDVRVVDDLAGQEDVAAGEAPARLVGVVDRAVDAVAEAELAREVDRQPPGCRGGSRRRGPRRRARCVGRGQLAGDGLLHVEALAEDQGLWTRPPNLPGRSKSRGARREVVERAQRAVAHAAGGQRPCSPSRNASSSSVATGVTARRAAGPRRRGRRRSAPPGDGPARTRGGSRSIWPSRHADDQAGGGRRRNPAAGRATAGEWRPGDLRERDDAGRALERLEPAEDLRLLRGEPLGGHDLVRLGVRVVRRSRRASARTSAKRDAALGAGLRCGCEAGVRPRRRSSRCAANAASSR